MGTYGSEEAWHSAENVPQPTGYFWLVGSLTRATSSFSDLPWDPEFALVILGAGKFIEAGHLSTHWQGFNVLTTQQSRETIRVYHDTGGQTQVLERPITVCQELRWNSEWPGLIEPGNPNS